MNKWFSYYWYEYLLKGSTGLRNLWCRIRNHPNGVVWYNVSGLEPDMHCKDCGEDLG